MGNLTAVQHLFLLLTASPVTQRTAAGSLDQFAPGVLQVVQSAYGLKYLAEEKDMASRLAHAVPTRNKNATAVVCGAALPKMPASELTDNGKEFADKVICNLLARYGIGPILPCLT